jgi:hypothetical protein
VSNYALRMSAMPWLNQITHTSSPQPCMDSHTSHPSGIECEQRHCIIWLLSCRARDVGLRAIKDQVPLFMSPFSFACVEGAHPGRLATPNDPWCFPLVQKRPIRPISSIDRQSCPNCPSQSKSLQPLLLSPFLSPSLFSEPLRLLGPSRR